MKNLPGIFICLAFHAAGLHFTNAGETIADRITYQTPIGPIGS